VFGIVAYAHAEGVDQPVGVLTQYAATIGSSGTWGYLTPHANYQGVWSYGTYDSGRRARQWGRHVRRGRATR